MLTKSVFFSIGWGGCRPAAAAFGCSNDRHSANEYFTFAHSLSRNHLAVNRWKVCVCVPTAPGSALKPTTPTVAPSTAPPTTKPPIQPTSRLGAFSSTAKPTSRPEAFSNPSTFSTTPKIKVTEGCSNCKVPVPTTKKPFSSLTDQPASVPPRGGSFGTPHPQTGGSFGTPRPQTGGSFGTPRPQTGTFGAQFSPPGGNVPPAGDIFSTTIPPPSIFAGTPPPSSAHPQVAGIFSTPLPPSSIFGRPSLPAAPEGHIPGSNIGTPRPPASSFLGPSSHAGPDRHLTGGITSTPHPPAGAFVGQSSPEVTEGHNIGEVTGTPRPPSGSFFGPSSPAGPDGTPSLTGGPKTPTVGNIAEKPLNAGRVPLGVEKTGLPNGITEADIMKLLYRFNYTVGFHGHHEEGYRNGDKVGGYFVNGRNGISTQVKYIANEFGYQPNITFVPIGLDSPDTPKEETEKNYGLKGYAFDWFYKR